MVNEAVTDSAFDATLLALADATRRQILARLARGEARVTELAQPFDISLNSVSKHIRMLERAGLVQRRVAGREHFISLQAGPLDQVLAWAAAQRQAWAVQLGALESVLLTDDAIDAARQPPRRKGKPE
jgi:DNA-binding transcriptional ArsR family regulator